MDKQLQDKVAAIALGTRTWAEDRAYQSDYNPDNLMGWCAIASAELHKRLTADGIAAEIHMSISLAHLCHCFCVVEDHVVDVTATQFWEYESKPVVIIHCREAEVNEYHKGAEVFGCSADLRRFQKRERWPSDQICFA